MLEFYAVTKLEPWPEDLPLERVGIGSINITEFHRYLPFLSNCFEERGIEASYFQDWIVPSDHVQSIRTCLSLALQDSEGAAAVALDWYIEVLGRCAGHTLLVVSD